MSFVDYKKEEIMINKIGHNKYTVKKEKGANNWNSNLLTKIFPSNLKKITAKIVLKSFGEKNSSYHLMSGVFPSDNFSNSFLHLYNLQTGIFCHSNDSSELKFIFYFFSHQFK